MRPLLPPPLARRLGHGADEGRGLLVDYWYSHAVGHTIEALRICLGYATGSPGLPVALVLNGASPVELAACAPFVETTYAIDFHDFGASRGNPRRALRHVPRTWDVVVEHQDVENPTHSDFEGYQRYYAASRAHFRARERRGPVRSEPPRYVPHQQLRLELPAAARERARATLGDRPALCVLPAGSSRRTALYPSLASWRLVLDALARRFPDHALCLIGRDDDGSARTASGYGRAQVIGLGSAFARVVDLYDLPLVDQLAVVEACDLFVSPHSGLGFAVLAVGTPWLAISGGDWHERFFNGVPFHSVLPDPERYGPCFVHSQPLPVIAADEDGEGERTVTMCAARIRDDLDEIVASAERLVAREVDYEQALADYFTRLLACYGGDRSHVTSFEDVHLRYLPPEPATGR
ncbi:MAG: glycosyltransferase family 9 protein [Gaiella sp.]